MQPVLTLGLLARFLFLGGSRDASRSELVALPVALRWRPSRGGLVDAGLIARRSVPLWEVLIGTQLGGMGKICCQEEPLGLSVAAGMALLFGPRTFVVDVFVLRRERSGQERPSTITVSLLVRGGGECSGV